MAQPRNRRFLADPALITFDDEIEDTPTPKVEVTAFVPGRFDGLTLSANDEWEPVTNDWEPAEVADNASYFGRCPRNAKGWCDEGGESPGGAGGQTAVKVRGKGDAPGYASEKNTVAGEPTTPPPPSKPAKPLYKPNVHADHNKDGITDAARVGVPGFSVPPPPKIGRVPYLTPFERQVEGKFINKYEADPDGVATDFRKEVYAMAAKKKIPPTFGVDDAKIMSDAWGGEPSHARSTARATLNVALHNTATALAKRAFLQHLDTLKEGDEVTVTVGGCGAGKGFAIGNNPKTGKPHVPEAAAARDRAKAIWDSAGDNCGVESPWVLQEAQRRKLKVNYIYVHADPYDSWSNPKFGVVKRADDKDDGRMVDAQVFGDSYEIGARNHKVLYEGHKNDPGVSFVFLHNKGVDGVAKLDGMPEEALNIERKGLTKFATEVVKTGKGPKGEIKVPPHVLRGATLYPRLWGVGS